MDGAPSEKFFRRLMEKLKCPNCGHRYDRNEISVLGRKEDFWFLSLFCPQCNNSGLVAAMIAAAQQPADELTPAERQRLSLLPPLSMDDVLDMHNWLKEFDSDFVRLFEPAAPSNE